MSLKFGDMTPESRRSEVTPEDRALDLQAKREEVARLARELADAGYRSLGKFDDDELAAALGGDAA